MERNYYRLFRHKNGYYYHRVRVPADIRPLYGKEIEQNSLNTMDFREALRRLPKVSVDVDERFAEFRATYACSLRERPASDAKQIAVRRIAADYGKKVEADEFNRRSLSFKTAQENFPLFLSALDLPEGLRGSLNQGDVVSCLVSFHRLYVEKRLVDIRQARLAGNFVRWEAVADQAAPGVDAVQRVALIRALMDAEIKVLQGWQDEPELIEHPKPTATVKAAPTPPLVPSKPILPIMSKLYRECFAAVGKEKKWNAKTEVARHAQMKLFIEIVGDKPISDYGQADIRTYKQVLTDLPSNSHSRTGFKNLSKVDAVKKAKEMGLPGLSVESIRQNMTAVSMVYGWTRANYDLTLQNYIVPLIPPPPSAAHKRDRREHLDTSDLQALFSQPVFTGVKSVAEWYEAGSVDMSKTGRFWVPLLGLFSGARLMEGVQLLRQDVGCENGIWFLSINDDDEEETGKTVKNYSSKRRIPLHPELVRLGFVEFVKTIPEGERLFPDIDIGPPAQRPRYASKMFNKLLRVAGVKSEKKVWHSLRHSFEQACRDSRVDSAIMDQLQGHTQKGMRAVYGDGYGLEALQDGVNSIRYEGLDLSHVRVCVCR